MALSDLRVSALEHYGGVDLKNNYRKFFSEGIVVSIGLHVLVLLLYVTYNFLTVKPSYIYPGFRTTNVLVTVPPPSILNNDPPPPATAISSRLPSPNDIPVPVPSLIEPVDVVPEAVITNGDPGSVISATPSTTPLQIPLQVQSVPLRSNIPDKTIWIEYSEEPLPIQDIQSLVEYPLNAKRTNIEGKVMLSALIGEDGRVISVDVEHSDHPWLRQAAVEAMMKARFTPAKQGTEAVKSWYTQTIIFKLN
jgi:periplasmic protein TonB